ncbi:MAG: tRNA pseudouridine synthase D [Pseudohongiella sp.]|nr:MAG: tRNA pseudouridine synthase D [Pseudohongiella sp.]
MPDDPSQTVFAGLDSLAYANGRPELAATLKQEFGDFQVDEALSFKFTEKGEHAYLWVEKTNLSTVDVAKKLSEATGVHGSEIGYSGMKDRRAETRQWFSVKLPEAREDDLGACESDSLRILETHRNSRKLKIGSHRSNHFKILLRDCEGTREQFEQRLRQLMTRGVPNYFGSQRFGRELSNLTQVQAWMSAELNPESGSGAAAAIPKQRFKRSMLFSAARSYLFNQLLSRRLELGNWDRYIPGDVLNLDGTERCFGVAAEVEWDSTLQKRLEEFDIHITGPLPGVVDSKDKYVSYGEAADIEDAVCKQFSTLLAGLRHFGLSAARRPLRFRPIDLAWEWRDSGRAEGAGELMLDFSLGKGAYATSLLRELCATREHG